LTRGVIEGLAGRAIPGLRDAKRGSSRRPAGPAEGFPPKACSAGSARRQVRETLRQIFSHGMPGRESGVWRCGIDDRGGQWALSIGGCELASSRGPLRRGRSWITYRAVPNKDRGSPYGARMHREHTNTSARRSTVDAFREGLHRAVSRRLSMRFYEPYRG
jgi:hypothetical protein